MEMDEAIRILQGDLPQPWDWEKINRYQAAVATILHAIQGGRWARRYDQTFQQEEARFCGPWKVIE